VLLLLPVVGYLGWQSFTNNRALSGKPAGGFAAAPSGAASSPAGVRVTSAADMTPAQYVASYAPRVVGLAYTAPRYDDLTKPTSAPFPAGCVKMAERCNCYTDQGTKLDTTVELCQQIARDGYFKDWGGSGARPVQVQGATGAGGRLAPS
jgi:zona occludens toxin